ncbi:unnamed protein product [Brachionus calyciflorus]|uniref:PH domain-containing protein n=1 Tax=Brachionus calyciflorus TaxID=104777 RepID=A0A813YMT9_9BILA|nr:unnamed protein product [Brachionus calyciflorus]
MANVSDDLSDRYVDCKQKTKVKENVSSSGPSSCDDENYDYDESTNMSAIQRTPNINFIANNNGVKKSKKRAVWELIEGYRDTNAVIQKPKNHEGILLKRRNWPMKGWHKRYFLLVDGILTYGKSKADLTKNRDKPHGIVNAYLSIVSYITSKRRILIDSSTHHSAVVCHLKAKSQTEFETWLELLKQHRLYYQYKYISSSTNRHYSFQSGNSGQDSTTTIVNNNVCSKLIDSTNLSSTSSSVNLNSLVKKQTAQEIANKNLLINLKIDHEVKAKQKNNQMDDNQLDINFKQVEENLMNLSKILSSLYLCTLSSSNNTINSSNQHLNSNNNGLAGLNSFIPHHQPQPSTSADFINMLNVNSKIHPSKSNPNLINETLQTTNTYSNVNSASNAVSNLISAGTMVLNIPPTISINSAASVSSPKINQKNQSTNSIASNVINEENLHRKNFYQDAKAIHDQLIFIYQKLLLKKENMLSHGSNIQASLSRSQRSQSVMSSVSLQDSQLKFYDAIEYFTSDTESDDDSDQESDQEINDSTKPESHATVPGGFSQNVKDQIEGILK